MSEIIGTVIVEHVKDPDQEMEVSKEDKIAIDKTARIFDLIDPITCESIMTKNSPGYVEVIVYDPKKEWLNGDGS
jgi:hypothetical protein